MTTARWFLAHSKSDPDHDIDTWRTHLTETLSRSGWDADVVAGRDDYATRAAALGGWKAWCRDVPCGTDFMGEPMFHGVVVPLEQAGSTVGKATAQMIEGFLKSGKHVYAWVPSSDTFIRVSATDQCDGDNWKAWACLVPTAPETETTNTTATNPEQS
jgi:hypothetical protein